MPVDRLDAQPADAGRVGPLPRAHARLAPSPNGGALATFADRDLQGLLEEEELTPSMAARARSYLGKFQGCKQRNLAMTGRFTCQRLNP